MLVVEGDIDLAVVDRLEAAVDHLIAADGRVELDLRGTTFMDCTSLTVLVAAHQRLGRNQEAIIIREPSRAVMRLLDLSGVGSLLDIRSDQRNGPVDATVW